MGAGGWMSLGQALRDTLLSPGGDNGKGSSQVPWPGPLTLAETPALSLHPWHERRPPPGPVPGSPSCLRSVVCPSPIPGRCRLPGTAGRLQALFTAGTPPA